MHQIDPIDYRILEHIRTNPGAPVLQVASVIGLSKSPTHKRLIKLAAAGFVEYGGLKQRITRLSPGIVLHGGKVYEIITA